MSVVKLQGVTVDVLSSETQAEVLRGEWQQLWEEANVKSVFQRPEWLLPWWRHLGYGELHILCARQNGLLAGLLPMFLATDASGVATLQLLGTGVTDYLDGLVHPEFEPEVSSAFYEYLHSASARWDACDFQQLRSGSLLLNRSRHDGWRDEITVQEICPTLKLPPRLEDLGDAVPPQMLKRLADYRAHLRKCGGSEIAGSDERSFDGDFTALVELGRSRGKAFRVGSLQTSPEAQQFLWEACRGLLAAGHLRLYSVRAQGKVIAASCAFHAAERTYYYLGETAPEAANLNPASIILGHAIEVAVRERAAEFDFLRGRAAYKYLWGAKGRLNYRRRLSRAQFSPSVVAHPYSELVTS